MNDPLVDAIRRDWGWTGIEPIAVTATSPFGHLIIRDHSGAFWYLDPEACSLERIATSDGELAAYMADAEVLDVWNAKSLVTLARQQIGAAGRDQCYALKVPPVLGGAYEAANLCRLPLTELVSFAGDIARQIEELPDGMPIRLRVVE